MRYADQLRATFSGLQLGLDDLPAIEPHDLATLADRVPPRAFAAVLHAHPVLRESLLAKAPGLAAFIEQVLVEHDPVRDEAELAELAGDLVWEIADLIVYAKHPEIYDRRTDSGWDFSEITAVESIAGKMVIDAGAGTGRLAFAAALEAKLVLAVEPGVAMRRFIGEKAAREGIKNVVPIEGFLHAIPVPDNFVDALITAHAIGWNLEAELQEIERVVKPGGFSVHLTGFPFDEANPIHDAVTGAPWHYQTAAYRETTGVKRKYWKRK